VYQIVTVPADAPEDQESLGSKYKFWFGSQQYLFKEAREPTGEDWAEKVCAEVAGLLGLPHAEYDLGLWRRSSLEVRGVVSRNFCGHGDTLILGNELLAEVDPEYAPGVSKFRVSAHTIERVLRTIQNKNPRFPFAWNAPTQISHPVELFAGYLLLDALVGNTDRHHENWGAVRSEGGQLHLAPTFDHASSLGCHESEDKKSSRLLTRDMNFTVEAFASKARSALYLNERDTRPLRTYEAFLAFAHQLPLAGKCWLDRLRGIDDAELGILVDEVPQERITEVSAEFAKRLLLANKSALTSMRDEL